MTGSPTITPDEFIHRWQHSAASERSNYALFLAGLCDVLDLPRPYPADEDALHDHVIDQRSLGGQPLTAEQFAARFKGARRDMSYSNVPPSAIIDSIQGKETMNGPTDSPQSRQGTGPAT